MEVHKVTLGSKFVLIYNYQKKSLQCYYSVFFFKLYKTHARIKIPCAGMFTILESGPISDQVNDYTDLLLMCLLL